MKINLILAAFVTMSGLANGQFRELWHLGQNDGNANDFTQELGGSPPEPGSASKRDDDYYFAGTYPAPIGVVSQDETTSDPIQPDNTSANPVGFERAVTSGSTNSRIHFNLSPSEADPAASYRFTLNLFGGGYWTGSAPGGYGTHDVEVRFNGNVIHTASNITENRSIVVDTLTPAAVGSVAGPNKVEIVRIGGVNATNTNPNAVNGWIQMDNIVLEIDETNIACTDAICNFRSSASVTTPGTPVTLNWLTSADAVVSIDNGVGGVAAGSNSVQVSPTKTTTYTMTSTLNGDTVTASVTVGVDLLYTFSSNVTDVSPTNPTATLSWTVDPAAGVTVSIDQGIGDVTAQTSGGFGSIEATAGSDIVYTITVTRPNSPVNDVETATVALDFEYDDYNLLWQLGVADNTPAEFNQELGGSFPAPGSASSRDDDYYFAGFYPTIGIVAQDETVTDPVDQSNLSAVPVGMERALTSGATDSRIHFMLDASQAVATNEYRFQMALVNGGWWNAATGASGAGFGTHDVDIFFNGVSIFSKTDITTSTPVREHFTASSVNAVVGENVVEIIRTGGASNPADPNPNGWIQFDYFSLESRASTASPLGFQISEFSRNKGTGSSVVTFPSSAGQTFKIEASPDLDDWTVLEAALLANPTESETTYTLSLPLDKGFVRVTRN